jgi:hypothetical protein
MQIAWGFFFSAAAFRCTEAALQSPMVLIGLLTMRT